MVLWDTSSPPSQFAGFPNKVLIPCLNNLFLDYWPVSSVNSMSLDSVTITPPGQSYCTGVAVALQSLNCVGLFMTPWTAAWQASLSFTISKSLLKLMSIESVMPSNHLILCHSLLLLPSLFPGIRVFSNESAVSCWPKYWSFSFNNTPSKEHSGLISFRMDWLDLLAVQGTLKSLLQHHSSSINSSVLSLL